MSNESQNNNLISKNNQNMIHDIFYPKKEIDPNVEKNINLSLEKYIRAFNKEEEEFVNKIPETDEEYKEILIFFKKEKELFFRFDKVSNYYCQYFNDTNRRKLWIIKGIFVLALVTPSILLLYSIYRPHKWKKALGMLSLTTIGYVASNIFKNEIIMQIYHNLFSHYSQKEVEEKINFLETSNIL
jgi:hypothetical protein